MSNKWLRKENPPQGVKYKEQLSVLVKKNMTLLRFILCLHLGTLKDDIINSFIFTAGSEHT